MSSNSTAMIEMPIEEARAIRQELAELKHIVLQLATMVSTTNNKGAKHAGHEDWISGDEACALLGIPISKSGTHLNRLTWLRQSGYLSRFGCRKPYTYSQKEVLDVLDRIQKGRLALPARA